MSYDESDAKQDEFYESIANELYPEHKEQAIVEFTIERLQSFYVANPEVMRPAVDAIQEGKLLIEGSHFAAAVVFFVTAIELLLKATVLRPVVHGLVHSPALAQIIVDQALGQSGFDRYTKLLSRLYSELAGLDINSIRRAQSKTSLIEECQDLQRERNHVIHQGAQCSTEAASRALEVATSVYNDIVFPLLGAIGLTVGEEGRILQRLK